MKKEKGFTAYYRRRLPTLQERVSEVCLEAYKHSVAKECYDTSTLYYYFKGIDLPTPVYHYWGAGDTV
jgi:hypothetical protein